MTKPTSEETIQTAYAYVRKEWPEIDAEWASRVSWLAATDWLDAWDEYPPTTPIEMWVSEYVRTLLDTACILA